MPKKTVPLTDIKVKATKPQTIDIMRSVVNSGHQISHAANLCS